MKFIRITKSSDKILDNLFNLYEEAFPKRERRKVSYFKYLIDNEERMYFYAIESNDSLAGFFVYWKFEDFYFLEYFTIYPTLRNQKIGQKILDYLNNNLKGIRIMEVEPADEGMALRRIKYYERNGYKIVKKDYKQPSYREDDEGLPLWLMSNIEDIEEIEKFIKIIFKEVYKRNI